MLGLSAVAATQVPARVSGSVVDATGSPLAGVTVTLRGPVGGSTETNAVGRFDFPALDAGSYELTAALRGFAPGRHPVTVATGEHATVSITLTVLMLDQAVVTASKTGEADAQRLPMAVSVVGSRDIDRLQDRTVEDIAGRAPNVFFTQNTGLAQVTIRGIGTNAVFAGSDPSTAVYLDGVYLARPADRKSTRLNSSHITRSRMPSSA